MPSMRCWSVRNILDLYVDGRLGRARMESARSHLEACAQCRGAAEELRGAGPLLKPDAYPKTPAGLAEAILKELESGVPEEDRPRSWRELLRLTPAQAAAVLYLAMLSGGHAAPGVPSQAADVPAEARWESL